MRGRVLGAALAAVAVALPARASAPVGPTVDWKAERARLAARLPLDSALLNSALLRDHDPGAKHYAALVPVGDLDGDRGGDVVDLRYRLATDATTGLRAEDTRIEVFRGRDGRRLWTRQLEPSFATFPMAAKVGPLGANGVVVVSYLARHAVAHDVVVTAYDGSGTQVWRTTLPGVHVHNVSRRSSVDGLLDAGPGAATDLVVTTRAVAGDARLSRTQVSVIDGATGAVRDVGEPVADEAYGLYAVPAGDLDGDRVDDVVLVDNEAGRGDMTALSVGRGTRLWTVTGLSRNDAWVVRGLPDVTGDGVRDVSVAAQPRRVEKPVAPTVTLVDGARGRTLWTRPGDGAVAIGDADRRRGSEVVVGEGTGARVALAAYDARGTALWRVTRTLPANDTIHTEATWGDVGDLAPDGVRDLGYGVEARTNDHVRRDDGVVDGRTGRVRRDARPGMYASAMPFDGRGSDTFTAAGDPSLHLTAFRGNGPERLWEVRVGAFGGVWATRTWEVDGDGCADVHVTLNTAGGLAEVVVSGATGTSLWVLRRNHHDPGVTSKPVSYDHRRWNRGRC